MLFEELSAAISLKNGGKVLQINERRFRNKFRSINLFLRKAIFLTLVLINETLIILSKIYIT